MAWLTFFCLSFIFLVSPLQWGLFFESNIYMWEWLTFILFIINIFWYLYKQPNILKENRVYFIVFLLPLMYVIAIPFAINPLGNLHTLLRFLMYSCFFLLLIWTKAALGNTKWFYHLFFLLGIIFLLYAIANLFGIIHLNSYMVGGGPERASGPVRYPNTFGAIIGAYWLYTFVFLTYRKTHNLIDFFLGCLLICYGIILFLTFSRGAYIFFAITLLIALILTYRRWKRWSVILLSIFILGLAERVKN